VLFASKLVVLFSSSYGYSTPTWKEKEHPPHAQQGGNVADPALRRSLRIEVQERVGGAAVVAFAQGGAAVGGQVGGQVVGQGGGRAAGRGHGGRGAWAAPAGQAGRPALGRGRSGGRAGSGPRFNRAELEHLNEIVEHVLPLCHNKWEQVAMQHSELYPMHNWCVANLKRKFWDMCSHQPPTGDPTCPPYIVSAKRILRLIEERLDADNLDGEEADIGFDEVDAIDGGEEGAVVEAEEGVNEPNVQRRLFPNSLPVARPLVRTPSSASRTS
jgi:hypothetical protein